MYKYLLFLLLSVNIFAQNFGWSLYPNKATFNIQKPNNTAITFLLKGSNVLYIDWGDGNIQSFSLNTSTNTTCAHTYTGSINTIIRFLNPSILTRIESTTASAISFSLSELAKTPRLTYFDIEGTGDIVTGNLSSLPSVMTYFVCTGSNTITGNLSSLPSVMTYFACSGSNTINDYTSPRTWANNMNTLILTPVAGGGLTAEMVDNLFIDLANVATWTGTKAITITGTNAAPTAASADARNTLSTTKGVTIVTN